MSVERRTDVVREEALEDVFWWISSLLFRRDDAEDDHRSGAHTMEMISYDFSHPIHTLVSLLADYSRFEVSNPSHNLPLVTPIHQFKLFLSILYS